MTKNLVLIQLNEINFDIIFKYINNGHKFKFFEKIKDNTLITKSEDIYENIEPWIQWFSVYTGKNFNEHGILRLGDGIKYNQKILFDEIEDMGFSVSSICPMNAPNNLKKPCFFIPDPWTETNPDNSNVSKKLYLSLKQIILDNSKSKMEFKSLLVIIYIFLFKINLKGKIKLINLAIKSINKKWYKVLFLDQFLFEVHKSFSKKTNPNFSSIFFNGGAHIQHHYFFNSKVINSTFRNPKWYVSKNNDPILDMIKFYDELLDELSQFSKSFLIATGLSQIPYDNIKFYYRLRDHNNFLKLIGVAYNNVQPLMTRDFVIHFDNDNLRNDAFELLNSISFNSIKIFGTIEKRFKSLFVTLSYPHEIEKNSTIKLNDIDINLYNHVVFVAIKNGMHCETGYAYFSENIKKYQPNENEKVSSLFYSIMNYFKIQI